MRRRNQILDADDSRYLVDTILDLAISLNLGTEVVMSALNYMKQNPDILEGDAMQLASKDWELTKKHNESLTRLAKMKKDL